MKFLNICSSVLDDKKLQKVRIKTDPAWLKTVGLEYVPNFEGYVLYECMNMGMPEIKIFVINSPAGFNPIQSVSPENIIPINEPKQEISTSNHSKLTLLKKAIIEKIEELGKKKEDPDVVQVINSKDIGFIETFLRQMGLTEEDLLNLYRKCFKKV